MLNLTYGKPPSANLTVEELVELLKVSDFCGAIASKIHAEVAVEKLLDTSNCAMLAELAFSRDCPLLLEQCGHFFLAKRDAVMESKGYEKIKQNADLMEYLNEFGTTKMDPPMVLSVYHLRTTLMVTPGCMLTDLDGCKKALISNLMRLTAATDAPPPQKKQKTAASSLAADAAVPQA
jgi:hypothetical protein